MNLNKIEKASKLLDQLKAIDQEITEMDKTAIKILNDEFKITFSIKLEPISKYEKPDLKIKIDNHMHDAMDMILKRYSGVPHFGFGESKLEAKQNDANSIAKEINDTTALSMLGVFLSEKNKEREKLMLQIEQLGFNF